MARAAWQTELATLEPAPWVFRDEPRTQTAMTRARGRAPRGARVRGAVPRTHGPNVSCLAALTPTGIWAPRVIEGAIDGQVFVPWLQQWLLPRLVPGTTIVLDNLSVHHNPAGRIAIEAAGCQVCYLPAYSPDFNPIELVFAQLKTYRRGVTARTLAPLIRAIGDGLATVTTSDIAGYYRHCGFPLPPKQPSCNSL